MVNHYRWDFIGLSTDVKPTYDTSEKVTDGSTFYCSDTSKLYVWCKDNWYEKTVSGGGEPYVLPIAGAETLGGIKVGNNLSINAETGVLDATDTTYTAGTGISISADNEISATGGGGGSDVFMLELSGSGANQKCVTPYADIKDAVNNKKLLMVHGIAINNGSYDSYHTFGFCTYDGTVGTTGTTQLAFICFERFSGDSYGNVKSKVLLLDNANQTLSNQGRFNSSNFLVTGYPTSAVSNKDGNILSEQALVNVIGILQNLNTTGKTTLVQAINEVNGNSKNVVISTGTPTTSTAGALGSLYVDNSTSACETYQCIDVNVDIITGDATYTWLKRW